MKQKSQHICQQSRGITCLFTLFMLFMAGLPLHAQRLHQPTGRSVVVVKRGGTSRTGDGGSGALASWRKLAQEPEGTTYNLYQRAKGSTEYTKVNSKPLTKTNYSLTASSLKANTEFAVSAIIDGVEGEKSAPFLYRAPAWDNVWFDFNFDNKVITANDYRTKFVWPMDLDGNGEVDAVVVDRLFAGATGGDDAEEQGDNTATTTHKIQAYMLDGTLLWTVDMGPNVNICAGQNDMVLAYDINCDGRCEVIIRSSDGTRFWDKQNETWGTYVGGSTKADTDGDGITDYRTQTRRNPPFYISVIDGRTGAELCHNELKYSQLSEGSGGDQYSRDNRSSYMNFGYGAMEGHYGIAYLDGIHPSLIMECEDRTTDKNHHGYVLTWDFDWANGKASNWHHSHTWVRNPVRPWCAEFHQIRILDSDGDGCDEMWAGGYGVNPAQNRFTSTGLEHGDRFIISDIDPDRPGLEGYAIQQSALLGQCLYDARTAERIKEWYLPSVFDVGRGACMDIDASRKGYEIYSFTDDYIYDCKGNSTGKTRSGNGITTCFEGFWWDGNLQREELSSPGGSGWGTNLMVTTVLGKSRLIEFSRESNWGTMGATGTRPAFMGDITGDWREEVILAKQNADQSIGLVGYSTNLPTNYSIYCLQQDPHYRGDCTTRGYYQHPNTGFYLGSEMPLPPLPPMLTADLRWQGGTWASGFTSYNQSQPLAYADGKSLMFDISGSNASPIEIQGEAKPGALYFMNPRNHDYTLVGNIGGEGSVVKSQLGTATINGNLTTTGRTLISEGTFALNGTMAGPLELRAKGTLAGNAILNDTVTFEGGLNYEGCRLIPGEDGFGIITSNRNMTLPGNVYLEVGVERLQPDCQDCEDVYASGLLKVEGNLTLKGTNYITIRENSVVAEGEYLLAECTGTLSCDPEKLKTRGLEGKNYDLEVRNGKQLMLVINPMRAPLQDVMWTGDESGAWDYKSKNFMAAGQETAFVPGDAVVFPEEATQRTVTLTDMLPTTGVRFTHDTGTYTLNGDGGLSGDATLTVDGQGAVVLNATKSNYTGKTVLNSGRVTVKNIENAGTESCFGVGKVIEIGKGTLIINSTNAATDRSITLTDTATIQIATGSATLKSAITGKGVMVKAGNGQVNLTYGGANSYKGTILQAGTLSMGAWNTTFGTATSPIQVTGNANITIFNNNSTGQVPTFQNKLTILQGKTLTMNTGQRCKIQGTLLGTGTMNISFPYVRGDFSMNCAQFEGTLNVTSGQFRITAATDLSKATFKLGGGVYAVHTQSQSGTETNLTTKIGSLTGTASDATLSTGTWNVGYLGKADTYAGRFTGTLNKYGDGTLTLTGSSTGALTLYAGRVNANATSASTTTGATTVRSGATLGGNGQVQNVSVQKGGTLTAGVNATTPATLTVNGTLTVSSGGILSLKVRPSATSVRTDALKVAGKTTLASPTFLLTLLGDTELSEGDELPLFTGTGSITLSGTPTFLPERPAPGLLWDTSTLSTDGKLRVKADPDGVEGVQSAKCEVQSYYHLDGRPAGQNPRRGIYVRDGKKVVR